MVNLTIAKGPGAFLVSVDGRAVAGVTKIKVAQTRRGRKVRITLDPQYVTFVDDDRPAPKLVNVPGERAECKS